MIRNIIYSFLFFDLILALSVLTFWAANDIQPHTVRFGTSFYSFFQTVALTFDTGNITIPTIPDLDLIPYLSRSSNNWLILNFLIFLFNSTLNLTNLFIFVANCILDAIRFFIILFTNFNSLVGIIKTM